MKIRKKEPSVGVLGKIVNSFSSSKQDTYSCNEINKIPMKILPENTNIDEILDNGNFAIFNAKGTLPSGFNPDDNNVFIESNLWYKDFGVQVLKSVRSQKRWIRHRSNKVWGEWSFENTYSTEETFTGKYWIDGKKIYRKVVKHTIETITGETTVIHTSMGHNIPNIETVFTDFEHSYFIRHVKGTGALKILQLNPVLSVINASGVEHRNARWIAASNTHIEYYLGNYAVYENETVDIVCTVEYTKTTN